MNDSFRVGASLERALLSALGRTLDFVGWIPDTQAMDLGPRTPDGADAAIPLRLANGYKAELRVHVKSDLRPGVFPSWAEPRLAPVMKRVAAVPVLVMPVVSPRLADLCRQAGWSWHDLAGNCWIDVPGSLHIERHGLPPVGRPRRPSANLGTAAAGRVIRALLSPAHAGRVWTQRSLQTETCWRGAAHKNEPVSLGLVNKVVRHLHDEGFVADIGLPRRIRHRDAVYRKRDDGSVDDTASRGVRVRDPGGLLNAWKNAYRFDRHERRSFFSLLRGNELREALYRAGLEAGGMAVYAAFSAAERQAPHVRQPKVWLYVGSAFVDSLVRHAKAKEVDSGENLVVLVPGDAGVFLSFEDLVVIEHKKQPLGVRNGILRHLAAILVPVSTDRRGQISEQLLRRHAKQFSTKSISAGDSEEITEGSGQDR